MNEQDNLTHQDITPQSIILELIDAGSNQMQNGPFHKDLASLTADDFNFKFKVKLSEYLNIKMLSDIAFQKTVLTQTEVRMQQERLQSSHIEQPAVDQIIK